MRYPAAIGFVIACWGLSACAADTPGAIERPSAQGAKDIAPSELKIAPSKSQPSEAREKESARPPANPAPAEARTPEEATRRAADTKDPSGALIIEKPPGTAGRP